MSEKEKFNKDMNEQLEKEKKEYRDYMYKTMMDMCEFNILITDGQMKQTQYGLEPGFILNPEFESKLNEHFRIQKELEQMDKKRGIDSTKDYGGLQRNHYIIGITINDFLELAPKNCQTCLNLVQKTRHDENSMKLMINHLKKDHVDFYEKQEKLNHHMSEWIQLIDNFIKMSLRHKEWRSKI